MTMAQATLKNELIAMNLYDTEADAITALTGAWKNYFTDAVTNALSIQSAVLNPAKSAMATAMTGLSITGAVAIQAGIIAWWGYLVSVATTAFTGCTLITPPTTLTGIVSALTPVFVNNIVHSLSEANAYDAIATVLHTNNLGGLATIPPPPGTTYPIL